MFEISSIPSFNTDKLIDGYEYDYVTRTAFNQGILQTTGFVNEENINPAGVWSLGLLQMTFFYRKKKWYAGQFVRKVTPKLELTNYAINFFTTILNMQSKILMNVLVRNVDEVFRNSVIKLPTQNGKIDFDFIESFVAELEAQRVAELEAYLNVTGLKDYELTKDEKISLDSLDNVEWKEYKLVDIFDVKNTKNILSSQVLFDSGKTPYLCASAENNSVASYINYDEKFIDKGNCIFIGGKTFVVTYQQYDFYSNDSHNLALYLKEQNNITAKKLLFLISCIVKGLKHKYSWGNSISNKKIQHDFLMLPIKNGSLDFEYMETLISAIQKLVIKDVVLYADKKIEATKEFVTNKSF